LGCSFSSSSAEHQQPAVQRQAGHLAVAGSHRHRRQQLVGRLQRQEGLAALVAAMQVARLGQQAEAAGVGQQQHLHRRTGPVVGDACRLQVDQRGDRHAVAAPAGQAATATL
jgi:hypothetical protein